LKTMNANQFQMDLIRQKYHIFNLDNTKIEGYYPRELLEIIDKIAHFEKNFKNLDLKLIMHENQVYVGEVITELPPMFVLKKGSKIKIKKESIVYQPNYK